MNLTHKMVYLKHVGAKQNAKVTLRQINGALTINIRDSRFYTFEDALFFLQRDAQLIVPEKAANI